MEPIKSKIELENRFKILHTVTVVQNSLILTITVIWLPKKIDHFV